MLRRQGRSTHIHVELTRHFVMSYVPTQTTEDILRVQLSEFDQRHLRTLKTTEISTVLGHVGWHQAPRGNADVLCRSTRYKSGTAANSRSASNVPPDIDECPKDWNVQTRTWPSSSENHALVSKRRGEPAMRGLALVRSISKNDTE